MLTLLYAAHIFRFNKLHLINWNLFSNFLVEPKKRVHVFRMARKQMADDKKPQVLDADQLKIIGI